MSAPSPRGPRARSVHAGRSSWRSLVLVLIPWLGVAACGSEDLDGLFAAPHDDTVTGEEAFQAGMVAMGDAQGRMDDPPLIVSVGRVGPEPFGASYIRVVLRGEVQHAPPDTCAIGHPDTPTGLVYLVSDPPATVEAVSLERDESISCIEEHRSTGA